MMALPRRATGRPGASSPRFVLLLLYGPLLVPIFFSFFRSSTARCSGTASRFDAYGTLLQQ